MNLLRPASNWLRNRSARARNNALSDGFRQTPVARFDLFSLAVRSMR